MKKSTRKRKNTGKNNSKKTKYALVSEQKGYPRKKKKKFKEKCPILTIQKSDESSNLRDWNSVEVNEPNSFKFESQPKTCTNQKPPADKVMFKGLSDPLNVFQRDALQDDSGDEQTAFDWGDSNLHQIMDPDPSDWDDFGKNNLLNKNKCSFLEENNDSFLQRQGEEILQTISDSNSHTETSEGGFMLNLGNVESNPEKRVWTDDHLLDPPDLYELDFASKDTSQRKSSTDQLLAGFQDILPPLNPKSSQNLHPKATLESNTFQEKGFYNQAKSASLQHMVYPSNPSRPQIPKPQEFQNQINYPGFVNYPPLYPPNQLGGMKQNLGMVHGFRGPNMMGPMMGYPGVPPRPWVPMVQPPAFGSHATLSNSNSGFDPSEKSERIYGTLKFYNEGAKFGFLIKETNKEDIFFHLTDMENSGISQEILTGRQACLPPSFDCLHRSPSRRMKSVGFSNSQFPVVCQICVGSKSPNTSQLRFLFTECNYRGKYDYSRKAMDIQLVDC